jgi:hypothetical protein
MRNPSDIKHLGLIRGLSKPSQGINGSLSLNTSKHGVGLFGKVNSKWYRFGNAQDINTKDLQLPLGGGNITTIGSDITLKPDGDLVIISDLIGGTTIIDKDSKRTTTSTTKALWIDFDATGISATGQTLTNVGLDLDMNCESVTHVGNIIQKGIVLEMVAALDGLQYQTGIDIKVTGGTLNTGLRIETADTHIKLAANADPTFDYATFAVADTGDLTIATVGNGTTDSDLILDADGSIILDPADGKYIAKNNGTEFSSANSAYAGMILGFTQVGADVADDSYALTTSYIIPNGALRVAFKTPPSEKVEIQATFYYEQGSGGRNVFASISNHGAYGSNSLIHPDQFEKAVSNDPLRAGNGVVTLSWYLDAGNLAAVGSTNILYFAAKCDSTAGTPTIYWGGDATDEYQNFVMKAIALPA